MSKKILTLPFTFTVLIAAAILALISPHLSVYMLIATLNFFLLLGGLSFRHKNRKAHAALMAAGVLSDLTLVLVLQIQREAVQTALSFELSNLNQAHILASSIATALYFPTVLLGVWLFKQKQPTHQTTQRTFHRRLGWTVIVFRTLGFALMFSMLKD